MSTLELVQLSVAQSKALIMNFEYVLGTIMGMYAVKLLLPAALGLIAGLITGFNNLKHLLPQSSMLGNMAVICAAIVMPLFAAFLATTFQVLGDERFLAPGILFLCMGVGVPLLFHKSLMDHTVTSSDINRTLSRMFKVQQFCYIMGCVFIYLYVIYDDALKKYATREYLKDLLDPLTIFYMVLRLMCSGILSKLATTDIAVSLAVHEFKDLTQMSEESKKRFVAMLTGMRLLRSQPAVSHHANANPAKPAKPATTMITEAPDRDEPCSGMI